MPNEICPSVPGRKLGEVDRTDGHPGCQHPAVRTRREAAHLPLGPQLRCHAAGRTVQEMGLLIGHPAAIEAKNRGRLLEWASPITRRVGHEPAARARIPDHHRGITGRRQESRAVGAECHRLRAQGMFPERGEQFPGSRSPDADVAGFSLFFEGSRHERAVGAVGQLRDDAARTRERREPLDGLRVPEFDVAAALRCHRQLPPVRTEGDGSHSVETGQHSQRLRGGAGPDSRCAVI